MGKSVVKLGRDMKQWDVWQKIKETIDGFKKTMPLISDMRNPAMRPRHWNKLMDTIQTRFDPYSDNFTLDSIVQLRLDQHAEFISEMSLNATKELAIEQTIQAIAATWKDLLLDMVSIFVLRCFVMFAISEDSLCYCVVFSKVLKKVGGAAPRRACFEGIVNQFPGTPCVVLILNH